MARQEKKTRIRGLPPKVLLAQRDARTGSLPTISRVASDNRTGKYSVKFDDRNTMMFLTSAQNVLPGIGVSIGGRGTQQILEFGADLLKAKIDDEPSGSLYTYLLQSNLNNSNNNTDAFGNPLNFTLVYTGSKPQTSSRFTTGPNGTNAFEFDGASFLFLSGTDSGANQSIYHITGAFTFQTLLYLKTEASGTGTSPSNPLDAVLVSCTDSGSNASMLYQISFGKVNNNWAIKLSAYSGGGRAATIVTNSVGGTIPFETNKWHHLTVLRKPDTPGSSTFRTWFYFDGEFFAKETSTQVRGLTFLHADLKLGSNGASGSNVRQLPPGSKMAATKMFGKILTDAEIRAEARKSLYGQWLMSGSVTKGVSDEFVSFTPGQDIPPFRDHFNPAVDGKSSKNPFYITGSQKNIVGEGFDQPLWSKSKIEIDLTPRISHSFGIQNNLGNNENYPMSYWNEDKKVWQGIGTGLEFQTYFSGTISTPVPFEDPAQDIKNFISDQAIGFSNSTLPSTTLTNFAKYIGRITNTFGFPFAHKYHATSSNLIPLSRYIDGPFVVEKIVLQFSGALDYQNLFSSSSTPGTTTNFFILNQRQNTNYNFVEKTTYTRYSGSTRFDEISDQRYFAPSSSNGQIISSFRDLVTYFRISGLRDSITDNDKELYTGDLDIDSVKWSGSFVVSGTAKSFYKAEDISMLFLHRDITSTPSSSITGISLSVRQSGRSGISAVGGRSFLNTFEEIPQDNFVTSLVLSPSISLNTYSPIEKTNPYVVFPEDNLILGWQVPLDLYIGHYSSTTTGSRVQQYDGIGPTLTFPAGGTAKLILYGSKISEGKESHDTLNQLLTSNNIHEVIE